MSHVPRLVILVGLLLGGRTTAESPPLWGKLTPGPHAVGFRSYWELDYSRRYNTTFEDKSTYAPGKAPRPILVNLWYPAERASDRKPMPHRDYLAIQSADARLGPFSMRLAEYNRAVIAKEMLGKEIKELSERETRLLEGFLATPTACRRDAPPAKGRYPLVLYHAGAGSSFEDNAVSCEFLASHGFVVAGSAFQDGTGKSLDIDAREASARDLDFLVAHLRHLTYVDWQHVGVVGHSAGAQAALAHRSHGNTMVDALVSLDTTQDYYSLTDPGWKYLVENVTRNRANTTGPLLMVANPHAFFELAESLSSARRYYLTIKPLGHNDFVSQGVISRKLRYELKKDAGGENAAKALAELSAVRAGYEALCVYVLRFLEAELKGTAASKEYLATQYRKTALGGDAPHVEYAAEGATGPVPYEAGASLPPTPRQLRHLLRKEGASKTIDLLRRLRKQHPTHPVYHDVFAFALACELLDTGKKDDAVAFRAFYREAGRDVVNMMIGRGEMYTLFKSNDLAAVWFKKALALEPEHAKAVKRLKLVEKPKAKP